MIDQTNVVIIGGGCAGAGIARDLSIRNVHCVLLEQKDPAYGLNDRCSDILHSGALYAVADPVAARECYYESRILRRIAGHYIKETGGFSVLLPGNDPGYAERLLHAMSQIGIPARKLSAGQAIDQEPALAPEVLEAIAVPDAVVNPFALALANAQSAREHGAQVLTECTAVSLMVGGGEVRGVRTRCHQSGEELEIRSSCVINAAGARVGEIVLPEGISIPLVLSREKFILMKGRLCKRVIHRCRAQGSGGDMVIPDDTNTITGTATESDRIAISPEEADNIIELSGQMIPGVLEARAIRAFSRTQPLLKLRGPQVEQSTSRGIVILDHGILDGAVGLYTVLGGGVTTYRRAAQLAADSVCRKLGNLAPCNTHREILPRIAYQGDKEFGSAHQDLTTADLQEILLLGDKGVKALRSLLEERWEGVRPLAWGERLREEELIRSIIMETFNLDNTQ